MCANNTRMARVNSSLHMKDNTRMSTLLTTEAGAVLPSARPSVVRQVRPWVNQVETGGRRAANRTHGTRLAGRLTWLAGRPVSLHAPRHSSPIDPLDCVVVSTR